MGPAGEVAERAGAGGGKAEVYARFGNPALLRLVRQRLPLGGSVLDVGCASGGLLAELEGQAGRREGIEPDHAAATAAGERVDRVHRGSIHDPLDIAPASFDVVVLGDVLEHLAEPLPALRVATGWLGSGGCLVISLPNVAHWSVRAHLAAGRWDYQPSGILDDTHLRFFTWDTGARLVTDAGLAVVERQAIVSRLDSHVRLPVPGRVERLWQRAGRRAPRLFAYQQLLVAQPA